MSHPHVLVREAAARALIALGTITTKVTRGNGPADLIAWAEASTTLPRHSTSELVPHAAGEVVQ